MRTKELKQTIGTDLTEGPSPIAITRRNSAPKAPGTRAGILQDWRLGSATEKAQRQRSQTLRDGR